MYNAGGSPDVDCQVYRYWIPGHDGPLAQKADKDTLVSDQRQFLIPFTIDKKAAEKIKEMRLFVSRDKGKTWELYSQVPAKWGEFIFRAPENGNYWFATQALGTDGRLSPKSKAALIPDLKMKLSFEPTWSREDEEALGRLRKLAKNAPTSQARLRYLKELANLEACKKAAEKAKATQTSPKQP
jgi:hypothetical protein